MGAHAVGDTSKFLMAADDNGKQPSMWLHGVSVNTLDSESNDSGLNPREAIDYDIGDTPASTMRALQMPQHECEDARCHSDHPTMQAYSTQSSKLIIAAIRHIIARKERIGPTYLWMGFGRVSVAPYTSWLHQQ